MTGALSQKLAALSLRGIDPYWESQLLVEYSKNHFTCEVLDGKVTVQRYRVVDGVIYCQGRILLTRASKLMEKILHATHDSLLSGHQGFIGIYQAIREIFSWEGLKEDVL